MDLSSNQNLKQLIRKKRIKLIRRLVIWGVLLIAVVIGGYYLFKPKEKVYILGTVKQGKLVQSTAIQGNVVPKRKSLLTAPYNGYVKKIYVYVGQKVRAGQNIVSVAQDLQSSSPVFPLKSPYNGTVTVIPASEGAYVTTGDTTNFLVEIDDLSSIYVKLDVTEVGVYHLKVGQLANIRITAILNKIYHGKVTRVSISAQSQQEVFGSSQTLFPVRVSIDDPTPDIKAGMSATAIITTNQVENALYLPQQFIYNKGDEYFVIRSNGGKQMVKVGLQTDLDIQILSGLSKGDKVREVDYANLFKDNNKSTKKPRK